MMKESGNPILERALRSRDQLLDEEYNRRRFAGEYSKFLFIGGINGFVFFSLYSFLFVVNPFGVDSVSTQHTIAYGLSWFLGSIEAHMLHRRVTFSSSQTKYGESLLWSQLVYLTVGTASTVSGYFMVEMFSLNNWLAWLIQSCVFGPLNFVGLRLVAFAPEIVDAESQSDE